MTGTALLVLIILLMGGVLVFLGLRRRSHRKVSGYPEYVRGLTLLLQERRDEAMRAFRNALEDPVYSLEARLWLGNLLRARGAVEQAVRLHESILAAAPASEALLRDAYLALAEDHRAAGAGSAVVDVLQRGVQSLGNDPALLVQLLFQLEREGNWDKALEIAATLERVTGRNLKRQVALYRVERAKEALAAGSPRRARADVRRALAKDPTCGPARLVLGDSYFQEGQVEKAVQEWLRVAKEHKELAPQVFARMERAFYEAGDYGRILEVYSEVLQIRPADPDVLCRLALHDERVGLLEKAVERFKQAAETAPAPVYALSMAAAILCELGRPADAAGVCRQIAHMTEKGVSYQCPFCGHKGDELHWRCPSCGRVGVFSSSQS